MKQFRSIEVKQQGQAVIVRFRSTSLERGGVQDDLLRDDLRRLLKCIRATHVIVDLAGVVNCSSGTLGALIETQKELAHRSGQLSLCHLDHHVRNKLRTLNLEDTVFATYETESDAIAAC